MANHGNIRETPSFLHRTHELFEHYRVALNACEGEHIFEWSLWFVKCVINPKRELPDWWTHPILRTDRILMAIETWHSRYLDAQTVMLITEQPGLRLNSVVPARDLVFRERDHLRLRGPGVVGVISIATVLPKGVSHIVQRYLKMNMLTLGQLCEFIAADGGGAPATDSHMFMCLESYQDASGRIIIDLKVRDHIVR